MEEKRKEAFSFVIPQSLLGAEMLWFTRKYSCEFVYRTVVPRCLYTHTPRAHKNGQLE